MPASDFEAITIPNLGALGRLAMRSARSVQLNVGAYASFVAYTVPVGRGALVLAVAARTEGGTAPTSFQFEVDDSAGVFVSSLGSDIWVRHLQPMVAPRMALLSDGWRLRVQMLGGDATTDVSYDFNVVEFDWSDFGA